MCTVSWAHQSGGFHLLCNRDEKRTRGAALAPQVKEIAGTRYIAPVDADFGGTWIAVNEWGLAICLLNGNAGQRISGRRLSRGLLIPELIWARSIDDAAFLMSRHDLTLFAPFTTVLLEPGQPANVVSWDGVRSTVNPNADFLAPLVSSSFDAPGVQRVRRVEFARLAGRAQAPDPARLYRFHASHGASPNAYSPCMHRADAETVSFSWIIVSPREIRFLYTPAAPCKGAPGEQEVLSRAA